MGFTVGSFCACGSLTTLENVKKEAVFFSLSILHPGLKGTVKATRTVIFNTGEPSGNSGYAYWGVLLACHGQKAGHLNVL